GDIIGHPEDWAEACGDAAALSNPDNETARDFFEAHFTPYHVFTDQHPEALFTGYYEPMLFGSMLATDRFNVPVYGVPKDLTPGQSYFSREDITNGAIATRAPILLYVDDAVMLFFMQVQGSGKVILPDGKIVGLQYAAQNGYPYVGIGPFMRD